MRYLLIITFIAAALALPVHADEEACDMLFVQDAKAMAFDGNRLTLKGANPNIIFFCDRAAAFSRLRRWSPSPAPAQGRAAYSTVAIPKMADTFGSNGKRGHKTLAGGAAFLIEPLNERI